MLRLEWRYNTNLCQQCWIYYIKCMVTTALAEALSCSGNVCFRIVWSCWRMTYRVIFWEKYTQQRWCVKCNALYTKFLIRMSMILRQQYRYHMQVTMPSLLRIWWHHKVHHMWFPIHSKKCCTRQERTFVRISFQLWMTIPHSCTTPLPMTRHGVSCMMRKSMVSQLGDISLHPCSARTGETQHCCVTTPTIFSKPVLFKLFFSYTSVTIPNMYVYH